MDIATGLVHQHPATRHMAGLAARLKARVMGERQKKESAKSRAIDTVIGAGTAASWAAIDHYFGGTEGEVSVGGFPVAPILGVALSAAAFLFGGDEDWADYASAAGDALIVLGTYSGVKAMLDAKSGGQ